MDDIKATERSVLKTFQEEIPSRYFSDKTEREYEAYKKNATYLYRDLLKFPPRMFEGCRLIDFGAGTGENTVYLANWGARCTLVEMNDRAQEISKNVFRRYTDNFEAHTFICSSIFDYESEEKYDIVHCRGVLSHTADKEGAFAKIASFLKPGGYLIFGDPNKAGGFQNMLQRLIVYRFASTWDEMVDVCERLFKPDIDRSERFVARTRRAIIFDRWVVPKQNDPSVSEVLRWLDDSHLVFYSSYPPVVYPVFGDSAHHQPKVLPQSFKDIGTLTEAVWLMQDEGDGREVARILKPLAEIARAQHALVDYVSDCNMNSEIHATIVRARIDEYLDAWHRADLTAHLRERLFLLFAEVRALFDVVDGGDLEQVRLFIENAQYLFRGAVGVRHVDYLAYRP
jgi:2-polyprenyl-3-methyl-5-hydroxy-6-metoxy-1,4-benzoquinol methylase